MYAVEFALIGVLACVIALAVQQLVGLILRLTYRRARLLPELQTAIASALAVAAIAGTLFLVHQRGVVEKPDDPGRMPEFSFDQKPPEYRDVWDSAFRIGAHAAFPFGGVLGCLAAFAGGGFLLVQSGTFVYDRAVEFAAVAISPIVRRLIRTMREDLAALDAGIAPLAAELKIPWQKHADAIDPDQLERESEQTVRRLTDQAVTDAETDLRELGAICTQWQTVRQCFKETKRKLTLFNADASEIDMLQEFMSQNKKALLLNIQRRRWLEVRHALTALPGLIDTKFPTPRVSPMNAACADLEIPDLSVLTPELLKAQYRKLARRYHPDHNRSPDAAERFQRIKRANDLLTTYLKQRGMAA